MRKIVFIAAFFSILQTQSFATGADSLTIKKVQELASQVQKKYAPDRRTEYFQIMALPGEPLRYSVEVSRPEAITELKSLLSSQKLSIALEEHVLPAGDMDGKIYGVINLSVANNRYAASHVAEMANQSLLGTPVKILKKYKGYYFVRTPDNYLSWTESAGVTPMTKGEFDSWRNAKKIIYLDTYGHAFSKASVTSGPVSDLVSGNILQVIGEESGFYKVSFPDKRIAYVPVDKAQAFDQWERRPDPGADQILNTARTMLGVPYLWGGTSAKGFDCSGFTKTSYFLNGIVLPRDASQQALVGEKVDIYENGTVSIAKCLGNLKPGDLLFFAGDKTNMRVTHTAIYIGNGEFIQSAGLVRINSMIKTAENYSDFESRTLVSARRILTSIGQPEVTRVDHHPYYKNIAE